MSRTSDAMIRTLPSIEGIKCIWKIENFSCLKSGTIQSPNFNSWEIMIMPFLSSEYIHIEIKRTAIYKNWYNNFAVELLNSKGAPLLCRRKSTRCGSTLILFHDIKKETVFGSKRSKFLPNDTLRVRCFLWYRIMKANEDWSIAGPSSLTSYLVCSRIELRTEVIEKTFSWNMKLNQLNEYKLSTAKKTYKFFSSSGDKVAIRLSNKPSNTELSVIFVRAEQIKCRISLLDPELKVSQFMNEEYIFYKMDQECTFRIPMIEDMLLHYRNPFSSNDSLSLEFACTFSIYEISNYKQLSESDIFVENSHLNAAIPITSSDKPEDTISRALIGILKEGLMSDFSFRVQDKTFPVHKTILSARSSVFRAMFTVDMKEKENSSVDIPDVEADTFQRMLDFIYSDSVNDDMQWESVSKLYSVADKYDLESLKQKCSMKLKSELCVSSVLDVLLLGDMHQDDDLKVAALDFVARNFNQIIGTELWDKFVKLLPRVGCSLEAFDAFLKLFKS